MKMVLKNLKASEGWLRCHMSNFFMGKGSVCHFGRQLYWKRKKKIDFLFFGFWIAVAEEERKPQRSVKNKH